MIEEQAIVVALEDTYALLQTQRKSSCQSCSVKKGCGTSVLSKVVGQRSSQIRVANTLDAQLGDTVLLGVQENALVLGSFVIYLAPLLSMFLMAVAGEFWAKANGYNSELVAVICALLGFSITILVIRFGFSNVNLKKRLQPEMLRILHHQSVTHDTMLAS
ncbi:MAG: SoxR reducing system RseC family protein [Gammaproteobacteria bacterium]|nr:SoxR reducing system RseC family protein [Gammaproteobacteria bacterium]MCW8911436.1 SoxR reducing system RseC family protein [Gammaproteobacteria bacterium]MCW9004549.1 SoxR reducing system RseC family protein [Gammaproteobacteria bacterium]MCW9055966.1 SoxR reducing system RseC family protein [Gammaproteobacteria bacterium]